MEERNCQLLFEYLRNILYDPKQPPLRLSELDEPYQKLGMGLQYLDKAVREMRDYSAALSRGILMEVTPSRENPLCANLKNIQSNLCHLTWQAKQVAKGDYTQAVSYLGEFSEAFNTMTAQLQDREAFLRAEAHREKEHAKVVGKYNQLLLDLIRHSNEDILITSVDQPELLYTSNNNLTEKQDEELLLRFRQRQQKGLVRPSARGTVHDWVWETEDEEHRFYRITTVLMEWQSRPAYAHIVLEITEDKLRHGELEREAHYDKLTKVGNRHYFYHQMEDLLQAKVPMVFCYCDLDHLKEVNDAYGHPEGDWYLTDFAETVKESIRENDVFARLGGDEFCIVLKKCPEEQAIEKMEAILQKFTRRGAKPYPKSFSYGIVPLTAGHEAADLDHILRQADAAMYQQKRARKNERK